MSINTSLGKAFAKNVRRRVLKDASRAVEIQKKTFNHLMKNLAKTSFGSDHGIKPSTSYSEFKKLVPVNDYEGLKSYFDRIAEGEKDVCWPGKPLYLAKTSGTTSGSKYIPITKASISNHIKSARNALLEYIAETGKADFIKGKLIFLSGSPVMEKKGGIHLGRLSGIVNHHVPAYLKKNQMPSWETNCLEDWEEKVSRITAETIDMDMRLISGIPPWVQMYFDLLQKQTSGKTIKEIFPNFQLLVYGGVNFSPYEQKLRDSIGGDIDTLELYPASEGFIAYQDSQVDKGMRLLTNEGIFYEFIPMENFHDEEPPRLSLEQVELDVNYALVLNSNAGLWGYSIGDTVRFVSLDPYKLVVSGRVKHFISAFGEHVIGEEVEFALKTAASKRGLAISEFTVAPQVNPTNEDLPYHEWFIEFQNPPKDMDVLASEVDVLLQARNVYYKDLRTGNILQTLKIRSLHEGAFIEYMKSQGKLGGQNKVPRLANDRKIADSLARMLPSSE
jgi:GH3 auxin-responsive promoter